MFHFLHVRETIYQFKFLTTHVDPFSVSTVAELAADGKRNLDHEELKIKCPNITNSINESDPLYKAGVFLRKSPVYIWTNWSTLFIE